MSEVRGHEPPAWWRAPAVIVAAGCLIALITYGLRTSFGLFLDPLSEGRGWGREVFALVATALHWPIAERRAPSFSSAPQPEPGS